MHSSDNLPRATQLVGNAHVLGLTGIVVLASIYSEGIRSI